MLLRCVASREVVPNKPCQDWVIQSIKDGLCDVLDCSSEPVACHALQAQKDKADMTKRLELLELQGQGGGSRGRPQQAAAGFSTWIVLLIAVLSFLVGKYLAVSRPAPTLPAVCIIVLC